MLIRRVIPSLLFSDGGLYKTIRFRNKKYVGDPINTIKLFNDLKVDELILLDIDATKKGSGPNFSLIEEIASECFMPLCYGGGITSVKEAEQIFSLGVEKISVNTGFLKNYKLVKELSRVFGSQSIVGAVDIKSNLWRKRQLYNYSKSRALSTNVVDYVSLLEDQGVGELFLTDVDREGTFRGFDLELINKIASKINIPTIAHGGAASLEDLKDAFEAGASAVSCGSKFIFEGPHRAVLINYLSEQEYRTLNPALFS